LVLNRNDITFSLKLRRRWPLAANVNIYEGRSINKLQNSAIPLILKIGKIRNIRFVGNLILKIHINFLDDDVIIVTSSVHRTQSICVLFSPPVFCHNSQVINSIGTRTKRISLTS